MDDDVNAAEALANRSRQCRAAFGGRDVRRDEQARVPEITRLTASCREERRTALAEPLCHGLPDTFGAASHETTPAGEFVGIDARFARRHLRLRRYATTSEMRASPCPSP